MFRNKMLSSVPLQKYLSISILVALGMSSGSFAIVAFESFAIAVRIPAELARWAAEDVLEESNRTNYVQWPLDCQLEHVDSG